MQRHCENAPDAVFAAICINRFLGGGMRFTFLSIGLAVVISGCASLDIEPALLALATLEKAEHLPPKSALADGSLRVAVSRFEIAGTGTSAKIAEDVGLPAVMATKLEALIGETGAKLVDRRDADTLLAEVMRAEEAGRVYAGAPIADYVVRGTVDGATMSARFQEKQSWQDKEGKTHVIPPKCQYSASVNGRVRFYAMPSLEVDLTVPVSGQSGTTEDTRRQESCQIGVDQYRLVTRAGETAIQQQRTAFMNLFAPKGYVLEKRTDGKKIFAFKISIGKNKRLMTGANVNFFTLKTVTNPLTNVTTTEEHFVAQGLVTTAIGNDYAWVLVKDGEKADRIRLGDYAKVDYERSLLQQLGLPM